MLLWMVKHKKKIIISVILLICLFGALFVNWYIAGAGLTILIPKLMKKFEKYKDEEQQIIQKIEHIKEKKIKEIEDLEVDLKQIEKGRDDIKGRIKYNEDYIKAVDNDIARLKPEL